MLCTCCACRRPCRTSEQLPRIGFAPAAAPLLLRALLTDSTHTGHRLVVSGTATAYCHAECVVDVTCRCRLQRGLLGGPDTSRTRCRAVVVAAPFEPIAHKLATAFYCGHALNGSLDVTMS